MNCLPTSAKHILAISCKASSQHVWNQACGILYKPEILLKETLLLVTFYESDTLLSAEIGVPLVYPMNDASVIQKDFAQLVCLVESANFKPIRVTWDTTDGEKLSGAKNFIIPNPTAYDLVSQITVNDSNWQSKTYQCNVKFRSNTITKVIPQGCDAPPEKPSVRLWQGTCPESNGNLEMNCQVYNLTSQGATVKWYINDQEGSFLKHELEFGKSQNYKFAMQSTIYISHSLWNNGVRVKCHVTDPITKKTAEDTIKKCSDSLNCLGINMFMAPPSIEDLYVYNTARIQCVAYNLKDANEDYSFKWSFPGASDTLKYETENPELHDNGMYSVISVLNVSPDVWNKQTEFTCVFSHKKLQTPIIMRIKKENVAKMSQPVPQVIPPSDEEIAQKERCTLFCIVQNFYPKDISVTWREKDMEVPKDQYINSEPKFETDGNTYFITSKLTIPCSSWDSGNSYSCVVGHEFLPMHFIRRSIDKYSVGCKPIGIKISVDEESEDIENPWEISATFISLFVLSLVYSITVTIFKVK